MAEPRSRSRREELAGRETARLAVRLAFAAAFVDSLSLADIRGRAEAEGYRQRCAAIFEPLLASPLLDEETLPLVRDLYGAAVAYLVRIGLDLKPIVRVTAGARLPSTLMAWQLYGDPARAIDLVDRNDIATPFAMPTLFDAEQP